MSVSIDGTGSIIGVDQGLNIVGLTTLTGGIILDDSISHIGDADTKIRFPAADTFTVETAGSERLRITSGGDVGIGTQSPETPRGNRGLEVAGTTGAEFVATRFDDNLVDGDFVGGFVFKNLDAGGSPNHFAGMYAKANGTAGSMDLHFTGDRAQYEADTADLTIRSSNVGIGTDNPAGKVDILNGTVRLSRTSTYTAHTNISITHESSSNYGSLYLDTSLDTAGFLFRTGGTTERLRITGLGGHRIKCNESWHAANLSECNNEKIALNINQTRQGQTKGIAIGCVGGGSGSTGIQAYDTSNNSANTLELNPFGGKLLYGDTASDLSSDHSTMFIGSKHAFQHDGNTGTYLSVILGSANGTVDIEADARSGGYPDLRFITNNDEQLRVLAAGHIWKKNDGALWHGTTDIDDFSGAGRSNYNKVSIRAGNPNDGTSPTNDNSAIKIYPVGTRGTTAGTLSGGIAWMHLDPCNGSWNTAYGAGAQMWMGSAIHDVPGQERSRFNLWMNSGTTGNSQPGNLAIEAYPNGMVRHPKVPAFMVRNTNNSGAFSGGAIATWNTEVLDNGSNFASNRFTAPIDGIYHFNCMMLSQAGTRLFHEFRVNGSTVTGTRSEGHAVSGSYQTNTITMTYSLSSSDYVEVYVGPNAGYGGNYTNFNGFLIG